MPFVGRICLSVNRRQNGIIFCRPKIPFGRYYVFWRSPKSSPKSFWRPKIPFAHVSECAGRSTGRCVQSEPPKKWARTNTPGPAWTDPKGRRIRRSLVDQTFVAQRGGRKDSFWTFFGRRVVALQCESNCQWFLEVDTAIGAAKCVGAEVLQFPRAGSSGPPLLVGIWNPVMFNKRFVTTIV